MNLFLRMVIQPATIAHTFGRCTAALQWSQSIYLQHIYLLHILDDLLYNIWFVFPALFLLDDGKRVWVWQGWWPRDANDLDPAERNGMITF